MNPDSNLHTPRPPFTPEGNRKQEPSMLTTVIGAEAGTTTLNTTEASDPWRREYRLGIGVDAVTGQLRASGVKAFTVSDTSPLAATYSYSLVQNESDLSTMISGSAKGSYNIEGVTVTAGTSFLNSVKVNELSVTLVAQLHVQRTQHSLAPSYQLAAPASPDYRDKYGDYFVAGYRAASSLYAVYQCAFRSVDDRQKFTATLAAKVPEVMTAEGSTEFEKAAKESSANVNIYISAQGVNSTIPTPSEGWNPGQVVKTLLPWFEKSQAPDPFEVYLMHYRLVDPTIPGTVPVDPSVFADLSVLYDRYWLCRSLFLTCPDFGRTQVEPAFKALKAKIEANQSQLADQPELIPGLMAECQNVLDALRAVNNRQAFVAQLAAAAKTEPKQGDLIDADKGRVRWNYGFSQSPMPGVDISSLSETVQQDWHIGWREHTFTISDAKKLLVGFDVICNWTDGTGGDWKKDCDQVIGRSSAAVYVKSDYDRGYSWTIVWYFVQARLYPPVK